MGIIKRWTGKLFPPAKEPDVLLFASRRGGSTVVAQMLASTPGTLLVDQPFDLFKPDIPEGQLKLQYLPQKELSQFITLSSDDEEKVRTYLKLIISGNLFRGAHYKSACRKVLKIVNASPLIDWMADLPNIKIVYLARHPAAQALSVVKNQWGITAKPYLDDVRWRSAYLNKEQIQLGYQLLESGTYLEKAVLNWILENIYPLQFSDTEKLVLFYEDLITQPDLEIQKICEFAKIAKPHALKNVLATPSKSYRLSDPTTIKAINEGESLGIIYKWQSEMTSLQTEALQLILDTFKVTCYRMDTPFPCK
ncbi:Sulfotransferase domain-containing protein [Catalinimonas alkaloidigena]|uniref:Sulfotransferase domain-containing protein n=1 Tax=Catalinimonas alkaloidigena TaxID=1075417 RepID=A0A1G9LHH4_9BACT|nr:sulfotransferase domain-containing protein [Catalinimonas alkaloidigena]SDL61297.1 Sulfotransferase domain-containing protein [Catalinimonas alkaloidigena]